MSKSKRADSTPSAPELKTAALGATHLDEPARSSGEKTVAGASLDAAISSIDVAALPERYEIHGEHARGGLGRILEATDVQLRRTVAVKELIEPGPTAAERFRREALMTARLQHPSIVPIFDLGFWDGGQPFYSMKMVTGRTLQDLIAECETLDERLGVLPKVLAIVDAVAYAHSERVIHRDLKPANVIVGDYGETVVIDWGLAKDLADNSKSQDDLDDQDPTAAADPGTLTRVGAVLGTPAYMPPEQARGEPADTRSDVYSLGAILYHLIAGDRPYAGTSGAEDVLARVASEPPENLRVKAPGAPSDLLAIVDKAMARDPSERYCDASEFAADLRRFETGKLVSVRDYSLFALLRRWVAQNRAVVTMSALLVLTLAIGTTISVGQIVEERNQASRERQRAEAALGRALAAERESTRRYETLVAARQTIAERDDAIADSKEELRRLLEIATRERATAEAEKKRAEEQTVLAEAATRRAEQAAEQARAEATRAEMIGAENLRLARKNQEQARRLRAEVERLQKQRVQIGDEL